ncbi:hypothetical protein ACF9IK_33545 [Kitasatospora hibisci]|uniref:hypothetical protein n=1 Tax=Kitasatospora hibisci TaxID=3369522 RepID=UPI0037545A42
MTSALTIGFTAPDRGALRSDAVVAEGARQFSLLAVENGYLLPTVVLEPAGYQGNLTAHLPAGLEVADEEGAPCPAALAAALRAVWAPADPTRLTVTGRRVLVSGASLPLEVVHPDPWDPADPPGEPLVVVVSWKVGYSGALAPGAAHAAVQLTFLPPGVSPSAAPDVEPPPLVLRDSRARGRRLRGEQGRVVAVDFGTTASTATVVDTSVISDRAVDATQQRALGRELAALTAPPPDAPESWCRALEGLRAEHLELDRQQHRTLTGAEALGRLGELDVATAVLLRVEAIRAGAVGDEQLQTWLADRLHRLVTATVATPPLDIHSLRPVPYPDGHGGETFAPATAIRRASEPLDRPGVSWYDDAGWELCAEDADGVTGLKRTFFEHRGAGPRDGLPAPVHLIQHLLRLLIEGAERHVDDGEEGEPPRMGTALLTYPTSALPQDREKLGRLVQDGLSIDTVDLRIDEGLAAGLYFLMRDLTANLELGLESLRASARPVPGRTDQWQRIMLVVDIGGGTSDIALLEMTLTDDTRLADPARAFVAGRHYKLSPRILGTIGHGQLGGDLLTLHVLYWIKARLVDALGPGRTMEGHGGKPLSVQVAEQTGEHRKELVSRPVRAELQRVLPTDWSGAAAPGDPDEVAVRKERFHRLWRIAEQAKRVLGQEDRPYLIDPADIIELTEGGGVLLSHPSAAVELPVAEFRMLVQPVLEHAATMAAALVADAFARAEPGNGRAEPVLDQVVLSGRTSAMKGVRRALESRLAARLLAEQGDGTRRTAVWNPSRIHTETGYLAKQATSIGAAWLHTIRGFQGHAAGLHADDAGNSEVQASELAVETKGLFACLPCDFGLLGQSGVLYSLFRSGTPYEELTPDGRLGLRSSWRRVVRRIDVQRPRAGSDAIQWGLLDIERIPEYKRYATPAVWDFEGTPEIRFQAEVDNRLRLFVLLCHGDPHYHVGAAETGSGEFGLDLHGAADGALVFDHYLGRLSVPGAICVSPARPDGKPGALTEVFPAHPEGADPRDYLDLLFHTSARPDPQIPPVPGRSARLRSPAGTAPHLDVLLKPAQGEPVRLGRLAVPPANSEAAADDLRFTLDAHGWLRVHRGHVPYPDADSFEHIEQRPGWVYRAEMEPGRREFNSYWDPTSGRH